MKLLDIPAQTPASEVDEEILEIFIEEVQEVLEEINNSFAEWKADPNDAEAATVLRRAFHTLKGSGRLVGATVIGELGWKFENMLNRVLDGSLPRNELLLSLIAQVADVIPGMIEHFRNTEAFDYKEVLLISQAECFAQTKGQSVGEFDAPEGVTVTQETPKVAIAESVAVKVETLAPVKVEPTVELEKIELESSDNFAGDALMSLGDGDQSFGELPNFDDFADTSTDIPNENPFGELPSGEGLFESSLDDLLAAEEIIPDVPTVAEKTPTPPVITSSTNEDDEELDPVLLDIFKHEAEQHLQSLKKFLIEYEDNPEQAMSQPPERAFHTLNGSSKSVNLLEIAAFAAPMEQLSRVMFERKVVPTPEQVALFYEAVDVIEKLLIGEKVDAAQKQRFLREVNLMQESVGKSISTPVASSVGTNENKVVASTIQPTPVPTVFAPPSPAPVVEHVHDVASDEFMSIFLDEADEILENTQSLLERWQANPQNMQLMKELQRELHTLKGGARMVGIIPMGDLSHQLESVLTKIVEGNAQSNPKLQEIVQTSVDELAAMLESVRHGEPLRSPLALIKQIEIGFAGGNLSQVNLPVEDTPKAVAPVVAKPKPVVTEEIEVSKPEKTADKDSEMDAEDRIRVRVTLIDKLTSLAGELSISRAHMEQQQGSVKINLGEMEQTVIRLRDQLRRLDIETEAQIMSSFRDMPDEDEFDPLELDRFSSMQQLSRGLMETVSDLLSIQDYMKTLTRQMDALLIQQTRIGAELQDGIMRTRMIPFSRISPRLQRIARLTSRELHKQVDFVINGENIEFERTVLNRIVAPLEHMLRNAIGHGVEEPDMRLQAGKSQTAKITVDLSREGTDLIIKLGDDGAGLNLSAIRAKAEERQLLKPGAVISDQDLMQFILEPAFSTAKAITQVSGRGVGMDVANSEIKQLGGSLQIHSRTGEGTLFEIRLPMSLTIHQALMVHLGEETMAIPLANVDAVLRAPAQEVLPQNQEDMRYYTYMDNDYRLCYLGELLGLGRPVVQDKCLMPMLLVRVAERRIALLVDKIEGSREIVVKPVGPQISNIRWIAGATILGDGRVVLILDVPTLARADTTIRREVTAPNSLGVMETTTVEAAPAVTIMVVDDSITVRKVTARLLKRQGMEVLTAKDGVDAVAQLQEHTPDLMLMDIEMPRMDGYELATQVRNTPHLKDVPIIMITSRTGTKHRDRAEKIGINRYLGKPFNETELLENINALLAEVRTRPKVEQPVA
jgi:chemosensory pili system protein ChpA (sensor histidine kinase/response regulator)